MYKKFQAKTVKEKTVENIKDFEKNKTLFTLTKPRSPQSIAVIEDLNDPWFVYITYYKTKSGIIADSSMIIAGDLETHVSHLQRLGWELKK
jgi:hypothetical protein